MSESGKWRRTVRRYKRENPPSEITGLWYCVIGGAGLTDNLMEYPMAFPLTLDHDIPRSRDPASKHEIKNLQPMCAYHNYKKGSRSLAEYKATNPPRRCLF